VNSPINGTPSRVAAAEKIQVATAADVHLLGRLIADAFADLEQNLWLVPDLQARPYVFPAYFALHVEIGVRHGVVHTTPQRDAVAVWLPVHDTVPSLPDYDTRLQRLAGTWTDRFHTFETAMESHHPPLGRHEYLAFLAVHPVRQRHGLGTRLLEHHHRLIDEHHLPAYLEAANRYGHDFYRLHGWREHGDPYLITPDGPSMHPMVRAPAPAGSGQWPHRQINGWPHGQDREPTP
jgi:GNAT superfamily N-acetyltransferase